MDFRGMFFVFFPRTSIASPCKIDFVSGVLYITALTSSTDKSSNFLSQTPPYILDQITTNNWCAYFESCQTSFNPGIPFQSVAGITPSV